MKIHNLGDVADRPNLFGAQKLKHLLLRLVPEMAKTPISTKPGAAAEVVPINRPAG